MPHPADNVTIALLQMDCSGMDRNANGQKAAAYCRRAAAMGADIILMPESWDNGCADYPGETREDMPKWQDMAIARDSDYVRGFQDLAKELQAAIVVTYLEKWPGAPRNSATLIDRRGRQVFTYAKVHTCDFGKEEAACTPGEDFYVEELDTAKGKIKVGMMICYDREHPESARVLALKGAELILTPNACRLDQVRIDQFRARAFENAVVAAMANYALRRNGCNGRSCCFGPDGKPLVRAGGREDVYLASFSIDDLREYRRKTIWGGAYRRPRRYTTITQPGELPEFTRTNGFGEPFEQSKR